MRSVLVAGQVALALVLLVGAGLMIHSFVSSTRKRTGRGPEEPPDVRLPVAFTRVVQGAWYVPRIGVVRREPDSRADGRARVRDDCRAVPGVLSVAAVSSPPFVGQGFAMPFLVEGRPLPADGNARGARQRSTDGGLLRSDVRFFPRDEHPAETGRDFDSRDRADAPPVVIISETMARQFFPNEDPVGQIHPVRLRSQRAPPPDRRASLATHSPVHSRRQPDRRCMCRTFSRGRRSSGRSSTCARA